MAGIVQTDASRFAPPVSVELLIVGSGACGLVAALRAKEQGLDPVVIERDALSIGSTGLSSGFIPACNSQIQHLAGIQDPVSNFVADIQKKAKHQAAPHLVQAYAQASGPAVDWLNSAHNIPFELLDGFLYPGHSVRRMHAVPEKTGRALMDYLVQAATRVDIDMLYNARVSDLVVSADRKILGIQYQQPNGAQQCIGCQALLLACNGYGGNPSLVQKWLPEMRNATFAGHTGNDGSAVLWGQQLGADLADLGGYQGHGSWALPQGVLVSWALMTRGAVQINRLGQRFHDESGGYSEAAVAVLRQPDSIAFDVYDQPLHEFALQFPDYRQAQAANAIREAGSIEELAGLIDCPPKELSKTLREVEQSVARPDPFMRRFERGLKSPYYAVKVTGALFHTQGGLAIDDQCRVLDTQQQPMDNLFAAGGAARGVSANSVDGYLSGNGLLSAVAGGYIAGLAAAKRARIS